MTTAPITKRSVLKKDNASFRKMSKARRRVAVAKDVIRLMKVGYLRPAHTGYANLSVNDRLMTKEFTHREVPTTKLPVRRLLREAEGCHVCALGGIFLASLLNVNGQIEKGLGLDNVGEILWENENGINRVVGSDSISEALRGLFDPHQLEMIETAYEGWGTFGEQESWRLQLNKLLDAVDSNSTDREDLKRSELTIYAIMLNIIQNKGEFDPSVPPTLPVTKRSQISI